MRSRSPKPFFACLLSLFGFILVLSACGRGKESKEFDKSIPAMPHSNAEYLDDTLSTGGGVGIDSDRELMMDSLSKAIPTRPGAVLLTGIKKLRLTPVFLVNFNPKTRESWVGTIRHHYTYDDYSESFEYGSLPDGRPKRLAVQHGNYLPGLEVVNGFRMVNIMHSNLETGQNSRVFSNPVLIHNLYFPSTTLDSILGIPVFRNYCLVSVFDEDTNKDGLLNAKDFRRFFYISPENGQIQPLLNRNYSVLGSDYDAFNDYMIVKAKLDENQNGLMEINDPVHLYWIDLKDPLHRGRLY
jgi:hypothetical protein